MGKNQHGIGVCAGEGYTHMKIVIVFGTRSLVAFYLCLRLSCGVADDECGGPEGRGRGNRGGGGGEGGEGRRSPPPAHSLAKEQLELRSFPTCADTPNSMRATRNDKLHNQIDDPANKSQRTNS